MKNIIISVVAILVLALAVYKGLDIMYHNKEAKISTAIDSKQEDNKNVFTAMWEIITLQAGVAEKYSEDFKEIYPSLVSGRYSHGGGQLMQWIQEHNPDFDTSLYKDLMKSIEAQRETFKTSQTQLLDLSRQHNELLKTQPASWFLGDIKPIKITIVVNNESNKAFATGVEEKMNLFSKKKDSVK